MEGWGILIFVGVYLLLQLWILPKLGISTCMRGGCSIDPPKSTGEAQGDDQVGEKRERVSATPTD